MSLLLLFHGATTTATEQRYVPGHKKTHDWTYSGPQPRSIEEVKAQRQRIKDAIDPPAKVEAVVQKIAKQAIERAKKYDGPSILETIEKNSQQEAQRLKQALAKSRIRYETDYAQLLMVEVWAMFIEIQLQAEEDEQIVALLMEM